MCGPQEGYDTVARLRHGFQNRALSRVHCTSSDNACIMHHEVFQATSEDLDRQTNKKMCFAPGPGHDRFYSKPVESPTQVCWNVLLGECYTAAASDPWVIDDSNGFVKTYLYIYIMRENQCAT